MTCIDSLTETGRAHGDVVCHTKYSNDLFVISFSVKNLS